MLMQLRPKISKGAGASAGSVAGQAEALAPAMKGASRSISASRGIPRDAALDFTKGALVLLMLLYHWLNYFVSVQGFGYRYIRFITPSFVFLAGFVITNLLASSGGRRPLFLASRLLVRGVKLLVFFTILNLVVFGLGLGGPPGGLDGISTFTVTALQTYVTGKGSGAAFLVLVPISYTLMIAGILQAARELFRVPVQVPTILLFVAVFTLHLSGFRSSILELISSGLLGLFLGSVLAQRRHQLRGHTSWLVTAHLLHVGAITSWGVPLVLQLISVCLNLWLLFRLGDSLASSGGTARLMSLLGQYTLLGYVGQIAILRLLAGGFWLLGLGQGEALLALIAALFLTVATVVVTESLRQKLHFVDAFYRFVFA